MANNTYEQGILLKEHAFLGEDYVGRSVDPKCHALLQHLRINQDRLPKAIWEMAIKFSII